MEGEKEKEGGEGESINGARQITALSVPVKHKPRFLPPNELPQPRCLNSSVDLPSDTHQAVFSHTHLEC